MLKPSAWISLPLVLIGCVSFPVADVRHAHADVDLVDGASVVPAGAEDDYLKQKAGYSHIERGNRVVLLIRDSDAKPEWMDSGSGEFLLVEMPAMSHGGYWKIGEESRVWYWGGSAWGFWNVSGIEGMVSASRSRGTSWSIRVDLTGLRMEGGRRVADPHGGDCMSLRHTFQATPIAFDEFRKKYPPVTGWTK